MTFANTNTRPTRAGFAGFGDLVRDVISGRKDAVRRTRIFLRTRDELSGLTDRELADIGIHRSQIDEISRKEAEVATAA